MKEPRKRQIGSARLLSMKVGDYSQCYDNHLKKLYETDKLINSSLKLNGNSISLTSYFNHLFTQKPLSPGYSVTKLLIITSPPFGGVDLVISHLKENYPVYQVFSSAFTEQINTSLEKAFTFYSTPDSKATFVLIKDYPLKLSEVSENYHSHFRDFKSILTYHLDNKEQTNLIFVLYWLDYSEKLYTLEKLLGKDIVHHAYCCLIDLRKITLIKVKGIIKFVCSAMSCQVKKEQIDLLAAANEGNLVKLKQSLEDFIKHRIAKGGAVDEDLNEKDFFHLLGKLLYNKRIDPVDKKVKAMKKSQLLTKPQPALYFSHQEIVDAIPIETEQFNYLLIEGAYEHFYDVKELALAADCFSFTNTFNKFEYTVKESNFEEAYTLSNMKMLLNAIAVTTFNLSQYDKSKAQFKTFKKSKYNFKKPFDEELYFNCISYNPSIACFNRKKFEHQVGYAYRHLINWFLNKFKKRNALSSVYAQLDFNQNDCIESLKDDFKKKNSFRDEPREGREVIVNGNEVRRKIIDRTISEEDILKAFEDNGSDVQCSIDESDDDDSKQ